MTWGLAAPKTPIFVFIGAPKARSGELSALVSEIGLKKGK